MWTQICARRKMIATLRSSPTRNIFFLKNVIDTFISKKCFVPHPFPLVFASVYHYNREKKTYRPYCSAFVDNCNIFKCSWCCYFHPWWQMALVQSLIPMKHACSCQWLAKGWNIFWVFACRLCLFANSWIHTWAFKKQEVYNFIRKKKCFTHHFVLSKSYNNPVNLLCPKHIR